MRVDRKLLLPIACTLIALMPVAAGAQLPQSGDETDVGVVLDFLDLVTQESPAMEALRASTQDIGQQAWGRDLQLGKFGLALTASVNPGEWELSLTDGTEIQDYGFFTETFSWQLGEPGEVEKALFGNLGINRLDRRVVAGELVGSTGTVLHIVGAVVGLAAEEDGGLPTAVALSILKHMEDRAAAIEAAEEYAKQLTGTVADGSGLSNFSSPLSQDGVGDFDFLGGSSAPSENCRIDCGNERNSRYSRCDRNKVICSAGVVASQIACLAGCAGSGPLAPVCATAWTAVAITLELGCADTYSECRRDANNDYLTCISTCL